MEPELRIAVDMLRRRIDELEGRVAALDGRTATPPEQMHSDISPAVLAAAQSGNTIEAIKLYRLETGLGLAEAKAAIDRLMGAGPGVSLH